LLTSWLSAEKSAKKREKPRKKIGAGQGRAKFGKKYKSSTGRSKGRNIA